MEDKNEQPIIDTSIVDSATNDEPPKVEPPKQSTLQETITSIKQGYETKLVEQKAEADKAIKERDEVIKQLLSGNGTATKPPSIVDKINAKRTYKKW